MLDKHPACHLSNRKLELHCPSLKRRAALCFLTFTNNSLSQDYIFVDTELQNSMMSDQFVRSSSILPFALIQKKHLLEA